MTIRKISRILVVIIALTVPLIVPATGADSIMPVGEIKRGMKGVGKTVFLGTEIERFDAEVIDVLPNAMPKQDLILVKISGNPAIDEAGVIAGMSGSPIYIDGRLIGALSYGWSFTKRAIAGVTPIESMFQDMERPGAGSAVSVRSGPVGAGELVPIATPLTVAGMPPSVFGELAETLAP